MIKIGDNFEIIKTLESGSINQVVTSPPYDNIRDYTGFPEYNLKRHRDLAKELYRVLADNGVLCWNVSDQTIKGCETLTSFAHARIFKKVGFNVKTMIWEKTVVSFPNPIDYNKSFEYVFICTKGKFTFNPIIDKEVLSDQNLGNYTKRQKNGEMKISKKPIRIINEFKKRGNVWIGNTAAQEKPCQKLYGHAPMPEWLATDLIRSYSNEGDLVLDPFFGGGTTGVCAENLHRKWIGIEISESIAGEAEERLRHISPTML